MLTITPQPRKEEFLIGDLVHLFKIEPYIGLIIELSPPPDYQCCKVLVGEEVLKVHTSKLMPFPLMEKLKTPDVFRRQVFDMVNKATELICDVITRQQVANTLSYVKYEFDVDRWSYILTLEKFPIKSNAHSKLLSEFSEFIANNTNGKVSAELNINYNCSPSILQWSS